MDVWIALEDLSTEERRSALYYAARYIKQADSFDRYGKDIFDDVMRSEPSQRVKNAVQEFIAAIETREGRPATEFEFRDVGRILAEITGREAELTSGLSSEALARGAELAASLTPPQPKRP